MKPRDRSARRIQAEIREVLHQRWDPFGIRGEPGLEDEYDFLIGHVYRLLFSEPSVEQVIDQLRSFETGVGDLGPGSAVLRDCALALLRIDLSI